MTRVIWAGTETTSMAEDIMARRRRRRSPARGRARRVPPWRLAAVAFLVIAVGAGAFSLRVSQIEVSGLAVADASRVQLALQPALEERWLLVDSSALARGLEDDPWVEGATVSRALPARLRVHLEEARPCYRLADGSAVDAHGRVLPAPMQVELSLLPLLEGAHPDPAGELGSATSIVTELSAALHEVAWTWPSGLDRIVIGATGQVELFTGDATRILLGHRDFRRRLQRLAAVRQRLEQSSRSIDLRFDRQVVIDTNIPPGDR